MKNTFSAKVELFTREKGWHYVAVPLNLSEPLEQLAERGLIAITAQVGSSSWPTSLLPLGDGTHFIALPTKVRQKESITLSQVIEVSFTARIR